MTIDVYQQYFAAKAEVNGIERRACSVLLQSDSENGEITYRVIVNLFPHRDEEDYGITYDAYYEEVIYQGKGRRSRKKEKMYREEMLRPVAERLIEGIGTIEWDRPLREARID